MRKIKVFEAAYVNKYIIGFGVNSYYFTSEFYSHYNYNHYPTSHYNTQQIGVIYLKNIEIDLFLSTNYLNHTLGSELILKKIRKIIK